MRDLYAWLIGFDSAALILILMLLLLPVKIEESVAEAEKTNFM